MTPLRYLRGQDSNLPRASRMVLGGCVCVALFLVCTYGRVPKTITRQHVVKHPGGAYQIPKGPSPSVNLVVAAMSTEDYSWVKDLRVPGLVVVPYIADNASAPHHPQRNKGHEAMIYHQYFFDFYDNLPDISILIHSQQRSWHVESLLDQSSESSTSRSTALYFTCLAGCLLREQILGGSQGSISIPMSTRLGNTNHFGGFQ